MYVEHTFTGFSDLHVINRGSQNIIPMEDECSKWTADAINVFQSLAAKRASRAGNPKTGDTNLTLESLIEVRPVASLNGLIKLLTWHNYFSRGCVAFMPRVTFENTHSVEQSTNAASEQTCHVA